MDAEGNARVPPAQSGPAGKMTVLGHVLLFAMSLTLGHPVLSFIAMILSYSCFLWGVRSERRRQQLAAKELDYELGEPVCPNCGRSAPAESRSVH